MSDVVSVMGTVASIAYCYWTVYVHSELRGMSAGLSGCVFCDWGVFDVVSVCLMWSAL